MVESASGDLTNPCIRSCGLPPIPEPDPTCGIISQKSWADANGAWLGQPRKVIEHELYPTIADQGVAPFLGRELADRVASLDTLLSELRY